MSRFRSPHNGYHLVVFDWDGTLADSISTIIECTQETLVELGQQRVDDEVIRNAIGLGLRETVERFAPGCDDEMFDRIVDVYRRLWFETYSHHPKLFPGVEEILDGLSRQGYLLAVATAKSRRGLNRDLAAAGLSDAFHATRTVDEARSKPHPQMILDILGELGVSPARALVVGDTTHDLEMAHNAGTGAVAVCCGSHDREALEKASPLACFESIRDLPDWLETQARKQGKD